MPQIRCAVAAAAAVAALAVVPAAASADATVSYIGPTVTVTSPTATEANEIGIVLEGTALRITESGAPQALAIGPLSRCRRQENNDPKVVICDTSAFGLNGITVDLGLGSDRLGAPAAPLSVAVPVTANGGAGDDTVVGGAGSDTLDGGLGNDFVFGAGGKDTQTGGDGDDTLEAARGDDRVDGEDGADTVAYDRSAKAVKVVLGAGGAETAGNGVPAAGDVPGENDTILRVEHVLGSVGGDQLTGNELGNVLDGRQGADTLDGAGGDDVLLGGDSLDQLLGGAGADGLDGGGNADTLDGGEGPDSYQGGPGADTLSTRDAVAEPQVDCGSEVDRLVADNTTDGASNCDAVAPQTVSPPSITGDPVEGVTLTLNPPFVTGGPFTKNERQWRRCAADGTRCSVVGTADTYKLGASDVGKILSVRVTVGNAAGEVTEESARTAPIADVPRPPGAGRPGEEPPPVFGRGPAAEIAAAAGKAALAARGKRLRLATGRRIACRDVLRTCSAQVTVTTKVKVKRKRKKRTKTVEVGYVRYLIKAGQATDVELLLAKSARKRLKAGRKVRLNLRIEVTQAGSDEVVRKFKLKLKVPRRKR